MKISNNYKIGIVPRFFAINLIEIEDFKQTILWHFLA